MEHYAKTVNNSTMTPATEKDLIKDRIGFTNPNLHRRVENDLPNPTQNCKIGVYDSIHSYRTTDDGLHDEESTTCEIP